MRKIYNVREDQTKPYGVVGMRRSAGTREQRKQHGFRWSRAKMHMENVRVDDGTGWKVGLFRGSKAVEIGFRRIQTDVRQGQRARTVSDFIPHVYRSLSEMQIVFIFPGKISCIAKVKRIKRLGGVHDRVPFRKQNVRAKATITVRRTCVPVPTGVWKFIGRALSNLRHVRKRTRPLINQLRCFYLRIENFSRSYRTLLVLR